MKRTTCRGGWIHPLLLLGTLVALGGGCAATEQAVPAPRSPAPAETTTEAEQVAPLEVSQAQVRATPAAVAPVAQQVALASPSAEPRALAVQVSPPPHPCDGRTGVLRLTTPSKGRAAKLGGTLTSSREAFDKRCAPTERIAPSEGATTTSYPPPMAGFTPHFRVDW